MLEGVPGIAKTTAAKLLAQTLDLEFGRIQFTPDLMPADVTGTNFFNVKKQEFEFKKGPIFANIVLIDEINRSPAKTQSALFEVMEESQISVDGETHHVPTPFMVLATQNPVEQEGTYRLPEAQQDRFMMKVVMKYPTLNEELEIIQRFGNAANVQENRPEIVVKPGALLQIKELVSNVFLHPDLQQYIAGMVHNTRSHKDLYLGASPRASLAIMRGSKAAAAIAGRNFVSPDDIRKVTFPVLNHRLILNPESEMDGVEINDVIDDIIRSVEVPR